MPAARPIHAFIIVAALMLVNWAAAAQSRLHVNSNVAVVHAMGPAHKGTSLAAIAYEDALNNQKEFRRYKDIIEGNLRKAGFKISADAKNSEYLAVISYGPEGRSPAKLCSRNPGASAGRRRPLLNCPVLGFPRAPRSAAISPTSGAASPCISSPPKASPGSGLSPFTALILSAKAFAASSPR